MDRAAYRRLLAEQLPEPDALPDAQSPAMPVPWSLSIDSLRGPVERSRLTSPADECLEYRF